MQADTKHPTMNHGYGTRVREITTGRDGMIVGRTSRGLRVLLEGGGNTNRGRHFGEGQERTRRPEELELRQP